MKSLFLPLVSLFIISFVKAQTSDTLYLRNGMKIPCKVIMEGPITIDFKNELKEKHKIKPADLDSIRYADGRKSKFEHNNGANLSDEGIDENELGNLIDDVIDLDSNQNKVLFKEDNPVKPKLEISNSENDKNMNSLNKRKLDSLSFELQKLNKRLDLQCVQSNAAGVYLKRTGYLYSGMILSDVLTSVCFAIAAYTGSSYNKTPSMSNTFAILGCMTAVVSVGCMVAIPISLINAGKVLQKKKLF